VATGGYSYNSEPVTVEEFRAEIETGTVWRKLVSLRSDELQSIRTFLDSCPAALIELTAAINDGPDNNLFDILAELNLPFPLVFTLFEFPAGLLLLPSGRSLLRDQITLALEALELGLEAAMGSRVAQYNAALPSRPKKQQKATRAVPATTQPPRSGKQEIDDYLAGIDEPKRETLEALRRTILEVVPDAEQCISYSMPAFRLRNTAGGKSAKSGGKVVAGFAAFKKHLSYFPHSGSVLGELTDELTHYPAVKATTKGTLQFPIDAPLPKALVEKLIAVRIRQLNDRGSVISPSDSAAK
jgi:uncharacterized protein YdhG (YjbR/CyaY superfamily)